MRQAADRSARRRLSAWGPVALVLVVLAGGVASYEWDLGGGTTSSRPDPRTEPAAVPPPPGVVLPVPPTPSPVASAVPVADEGKMSKRKLTRVLAPLLADGVLGKHVVAGVADLSTGGVVFERGTMARPASTTKLLTTAAALSVLGDDHRFATEAVLERRRGQRWLVLVGGGDPYLASKPAAADESPYPPRADLLTLARATATALKAKGVRRVRLGYDDSLFTGPGASGAWEPSYVPDGVVSPIRALWADEGRPADGTGRVSDPPLTAATYFAIDLRAAGLTVDGPPAHVVAGKGAHRVADVRSAPLSEIVERVLDVSDNEAAEVLGHQVGVAATGDGSFAGGVQGVLRTLRGLGVPVAGDTLHDGSGLSRDNRLTPATLLAVLRLAASDDHPELRPVLTGLPVAGFTGSLADRFAHAPPAAKGRVRAKTGTLHGTSSLAGVATDLDGTTVAFFLAADRVAEPKETAAENTLDRIAAAIAGCHCSVSAP